MGVDNFKIHSKNKVLIEEINEVKEKATASGFVLPEGDTGDLAQIGRVVQSTVPSIAVGDEVIYNKFVPQEVRVEGEKYYMLDDVDILMIRGK